MSLLDLFIISVYILPFSYVLSLFVSMGWHKAKLDYHHAIMKFLESTANEP